MKGSKARQPRGMGPGAQGSSLTMAEVRRPEQRHVQSTHVLIGWPWVAGAMEARSTRGPHSDLPWGSMPAGALGRRPERRHLPNPQMPLAQGPHSITLAPGIQLALARGPPGRTKACTEPEGAPA